MADVPSPPTPYKMLSRTYQSSLRWSPGYLDRITVDDRRYRHYQDKVQATAPLQKSQSSSSEIKKMGDKFFFVHRNIPIQQQYSRTSLKRSDVRPWDELVDRPLMGKRVRDKEVQQPYPQEHPYSSHVPHYLIFPDPYPHPPNPRTNPPLTPKTPLLPDIKQQTTPPPLIKDPESDDTKVESTKEVESEEEEEKEEDEEEETDQPEGSKSEEQQWVSTDSRYPCNPPRKNYVARKAYDFGTRVEVLDLNSMRKTPEIEHLLWQMPKGFPHKRCITYPTPSHQFSRQPTTPNYLQLPSSYLPSTPSSTTYYNYPHHVQDVVADFHRAMCRTTSYTDHFPAHSVPPSRGSIDRTLRSVSSFRPFTSEQRGKYHFNTGSGLNVTSRPGTENAALKFQATEEKDTESDYMDGGDDDVIVADDKTEETGVERREICEDGNRSNNHKIWKEMAEKREKEGDSNVTASSAPPRLAIDIHQEPPPPDSGSRRIPPASRVMTKLYKFPPIEEKALRFPTIITSPQTPDDSAQNNTAYMKLGPPPPSRGIGALLTPPSIKVRHAHAQHSSLPLPHVLSQNIAEVHQQSVPKTLSHAEIVKHFTRNLQQQLYSSPDMRRVTMKEGKKHEFLGHHAYDFH